MTVSFYNSASYVDAKQYGIVADGTDQWAALTALMATLADGGADPDGAKVILPLGIIGLSQTLVIPNKVSVHGQGRRSTRLKALAGFATSTPVISLGALYDAGIVNGVAFDCYLQDLTVDANSIAGSIGVITAYGQEGSGLRGVLLTGFKGDGFKAVTPGAGFTAANLMFTDVEAYGASSSVNGMNFDGVGGANLVQRITCNGGAVSGIRFKNTALFGGSLHMEALTYGLYADGGNALCDIQGLTNPGLAVTHLFYCFGNRAVVHGLVKGAATNIVKDDVAGMTLTDAFLSSYGGDKHYVGHIIRQTYAVGFTAGVVAPDMQYPSYNRVNTLTQNVSVSAPLNPQIGMELTMRFVQDATGGRTVTWNSIYKGVTLAASGTASQRSIIKFFYDGTYWLQTGTSGWVS